MANRRKFIGQLAALGIASSLPSYLKAQHQPADQMIWANLLHLSYNMWEDSIPQKYRDENYNCARCPEAREWAHPYRTNLTLDEPAWDVLLKEMAAARMNMVLLDLGDAVVYDSHAEIAVKNAWTPE